MWEEVALELVTGCRAVEGRGPGWETNGLGPVLFLF